MATEIISTGKNCEFCGKPLMAQRMRLMDNVFEHNIKCDCVIAKEEAEKAEAVQLGTPIVRNRWREQSGLRKRQRLQTFAVFTPRPGQRDAFKAAKDFAEQYVRDRKTVTTGLMLMGSVGCGKTHLGAAIVNAIIDAAPVDDAMAYEAETHGGGQQGRRPNIQFAPMVSILEEIRQSYNEDGESAQAILQKYSRAHLLVLDDIGTERPTEWVLERLYEIIDHRYNEMLPTIATTNLTPSTLKSAVGERVADRLREICRLVPIDAKSQRKNAS